MDERKENMQEWLLALGYDLNSLQTASEDASFRRYFRIKKEGESYIVMDAPPENEPCDTFVTLANRLTANNINAPKIFEQNMAQGYLVLSDFGDDLLLGLLNNKTVDHLYGEAMSALSHMQINMPSTDIPIYTEQLLNTEMELFKDWFIEKLFGIKLNEKQQNLWQQTKDELIKNAVAQPQTFVHRDFHSRNLIKTLDGQVGLIDFQDAVKGPLTYDLVSLLRDCYINWPDQQIDQWVNNFYIKTKGCLQNVTYFQFKEWFDLMGVQRHLKAVGIFSRLKLRDSKNGYIADIPRTLNYVLNVSNEKNSLSGLNMLINELGLMEKINNLVHEQAQ